MLSDHFRGGVSEQTFRPAVPTLDDAFKILADDGIVRRLHDRGEPLLKLHGSVSVRDIAGNLGSSNDRSRSVPDRRNGEGDVENSSIFGPAPGFVMLNP